MADPIADMIRLDAQKRQSEAAKRTATGLMLDSTSPEAMAEGLRIGQEIGVPASVVAQSPDVFRKQAEQKRTAQTLVNAPRTQRFLNDPVAAAIAKDDVERLTWFENSLGALGRAAGRGTRRISAAPSYFTAVASAQRAKDVGTSLDDLIAEEMARIGGDQAPASLRVQALQIAKTRFDAVEGQGEGEREAYIRQGAEALADAQTIVEKAQSIEMSDAASGFRDESLANADNSVMGALAAFGSDPLRGAAFIAETAAEFLPVLAASSAVTLLTRTPAAGALTMGGGSTLVENVAESMQFLQEQGVDMSSPEAAMAVLGNEALIEEAQKRGITKGLVIGLFDAFSGGVAGQQLMNSPAGDLISQGLAQVMFGAGGEAASQAAIGDEIDWRDVVVEGLAELATAPIEVLGVGGRGLVNKLGSYKRAGDTATRLDAIDQTVAQSKLKERSPEKFREFANEVGMAERDFYVPADGLREYFQAKDVTFEEALEGLEIDPVEFLEMEAAGGEVAISEAVYASKISGTDDAAWFRDNARIGDDMSVADAMRFNDEVQQVMQEAWERAEDDRLTELELRASDQQVYDNVYSQLREAGRSVDVARNEAQVWSSFWRTMGQRYGEDPLELARMMGVEFRGPEQVAGRKRGDLDLRLNTLRAKGDKALKPAGSSLTEFVKDRGGIRDTGGDLESMDPPKGPIAETAAQVRERQSQPTLGGMPSQGKGVDVNEMARAAAEAGYLPGVDPQDAVTAFMAAIDAELRGEPTFIPGQGVDPDMAALADELSARGIDLSTMDNDAVAAAVETETAPANEAAELADGTKVQPADVGSAAFTRWFEGSKVVDQSGNPLVVYHATNADMSGDFAFALGVQKGLDKTQSNAFYFSQDGELRGIIRDQMENEGGFYLSVKNPLDMTDAQVRETVARAAADEAEAIAQMNVALYDAEMAERAARRDGGDVAQAEADVSRAQQEIDDAYQRQMDGETLHGGGRQADWTRPQTWLMLQQDSRKANEEMNRLVNWARQNGYDGLRFTDGGEMQTASSITDVSGVTWVAFEPTQIKSVNNRGTFDPADPRILYQPDGSGQRGSIQFPRGGLREGQTVISLFENADLSTVTHEAGHFFLEAFSVLATQDAAPQQMRDDLQAIYKWLKVTDVSQIETKHHEKWARGFESYVMSGDAPSLALADAFARFKAWLTRIYKTALGLNVRMTDEVREVMDRMLATDAEIAEARAEQNMSPLFTEKPAGMSDQDWATYQRMARRSEEQASQRLLKKTMAAIRRQKEAWWKEERAELETQVAGEINGQPVYRLIEMLSNGRWIGNDDMDIPDMRIDRDALVEQFGEGVLAEVGKSRLGGKRAIYTTSKDEAGSTPQEAAELFGFRNAGQMVEALQNAPRRKDLIQQETDRRMIERHGDTLNDGTIEAEALAAIHSEQQAMTVSAEARQLARQMGRDTRGMTQRVYRQRAKSMLGRMSVKQASQPSQFLAAERRAAHRAQEAFAKVARGTNAEAALAEALQAKEQQVLNGMLFDESRKFEAEVNKRREAMRAFGKKDVRAKIGSPYIDQIDAILEGYDFRRRSPKQVARMESLREFVAQMEAQGREAELNIDVRLMDEAHRKHYSRLSVDEARGLFDTVDNLEHLGRFKNQLRDRQRKRDLLETARSVEAQVREAPARDPNDKRWGLKALNLLRRPDTIMVSLDRGDEMGTVYEAIKRSVDEGQAEEQRLSVRMAQRMDDLFRSHYKPKVMREMQKPRQIVEGRQWSKAEILALALNTGNEANFQRLMDPNVSADSVMTREKMDTLLAEMDANDWAFVQAIWDEIDSYWPDLAEVNKRRTGVVPKKVPAKLMVDAPSSVKGGYYPIKYDPTRGQKAAKDEETGWDRFVTAGHGSTTQVANGMTKQREKSGGGRTLLFDLSVPFKHMRDTIRYISLSEAVDTSYRVLNHPIVVEAMQQTGNTDTLQTLNLWLQDTAQGPIFNTDLLNSAARMVKNNFTMSRLAFNLKTIALQVTGLGQSAATIGKRNMMRGMMAYAKRPHAMIQDVTARSPFMAERQTTWQKDILDFLNEAELQGPMKSRLREAKTITAKAGFWPIVKTQFLAVDMPTWLGAYDAGLERYKGDEAKAVLFADRMVARAQDSGLFADRAGVERGTVGRNTRQSDFIRLWTTLGGYMLTKLNRAQVSTMQARMGLQNADTNVARVAIAMHYATDMMLLFMFEAVLMGTAYALMADDDVDDEDLRKFMIEETGMAMVGGIPMVRDAASAFRGYGGGGVYGSVMEVPAKLLTQVAQGENDRALRRAIGDLIGVATGLPTTASTRIIEGLLEPDETSPAEALFGTNPLTR